MARDAHGDTFTINDSLELPRVGSVTVNPSGSLFMVFVAQADLGSRSSCWIYVSAVDNAEHNIKISLSAPGDVLWLDDYVIGYISQGQDGKATLSAYALKRDADKIISYLEPVNVGALPTGAENFIYRPLAQTLAFSAAVYEDFDLDKVEDHDREWNARGHTGLVYDHPNVRNIDTWRGPKRPSLFTVTLKRTQKGWKLGATYNAPLKSVKHHAPSDPYGSTDEFDISATSLAYVMKPDSYTPWQTKTNVYLVDLIGTSEPLELTVGDHGLTHQPRFNHSGDVVAWLQASVDGNETDKTFIVTYDVRSGVRTVISPPWDFSPESFVFSHDDKSVYLTAPHFGRGKIFTHRISGTANSNEVLRELTSSGTASSLVALPNGRLLFMHSSYDAPNDVFIMKSSTQSLQTGRVEEVQITNFYNEQLTGKTMRGGEDIWWTGGAQLERKVQGWVLTPPGFKKGEIGKYPALMMIHGGPSALWQDMWFPRFNLNTYANQGYIVFAPNGTGSTSFGQEFQDAIAEDWGGAPFQDMRAGWTEFLKQYPEVDCTRTAGWGASWGGYGVAWLQGQPQYDFGFNAYVSICGLFDTALAGWSMDNAHIFNNGFGGFPWEEKAMALSDKFSPSRYVSKWSKPMLIVHGGKDYSVSVNHTLGAFRALQQRNIPSRLVVFPDENHYISNPGNIVKLYEEIFAWLAKYTNAGTK